MWSRRVAFEGRRRGPSLGKGQVPDGLALLVDDGGVVDDVLIAEGVAPLDVGPRVLGDEGVGSRGMPARGYGEAWHQEGERAGRTDRAAGELSSTVLQTHRLHRVAGAPAFRRRTGTVIGFAEAVAKKGVAPASAPSASKILNSNRGDALGPGDLSDRAEDAVGVGGDGHRERGLARGARG